MGVVDPRRRCVVTLEIRGPDGQQEVVEFQVDTGFSGSLLLPLEVVKRLNLPETESITMRLADSSRVKVPRYLAHVIWDGVEKSVALPASGHQPLLGTGLLDSHRLDAEIKPGGSVTITALTKVTHSAAP